MNPGEQFKIESVEEFEQAREMFKDRWYHNSKDDEIVLNDGWSYIVCYEDGEVLLDRKREINKTIPSPLKPKHEVLQEEPDLDIPFKLMKGQQFLAKNEADLDMFEYTQGFRNYKVAKEKFRIGFSYITNHGYYCDVCNRIESYEEVPHPWLNVDEDNSIFYKAENTEPLSEQKEEVFNPQSHYDNSKGSLYLWCEEKGLNSWEFDIIKRVMRCRKKGKFTDDLQKTKDLIDIYISEYKEK